VFDFFRWPPLQATLNCSSNNRVDFIPFELEQFRSSLNRTAGVENLDCNRLE
jgi:hypothetical protein